MNSTSTLQELLLAARTIRAAQHDRDAELDAVRDEAEESGFTDRYEKARSDALDDTAEDLWRLVDLIDTLAASLSSDAAAAADDLRALAHSRVGEAAAGERGEATHHSADQGADQAGDVDVQGDTREHALVTVDDVARCPTEK